MLVTLLLTVSFYCQAQYVTIPDLNFRNKLMQLYPSCFNGLQQMDTTCNDIINETELYIGQLSIASVEGIQYFDNLDSLDFTINQISVLPPLPNSLKYLRCGQNSLTSVPVLPDSLEYFDCMQNSITVLPPLPLSLKKLGCQRNLLNVIPVLPPSILELWISENPLNSLPLLPPNLTLFSCGHLNLDTLPNLPNTLKTLYCNNNNLTSIAKMPDSLEMLYCKNNKLINLPSLNTSLQYLYCDTNQLTVLPPLPSSLLSLSCFTNKLTSIPSLPGNLYGLNCNNNPFLNCLPLLPQSLTTLQIGLTNIACIPNLVNGINIPLPICPNGSACESSPTLSGHVFNDVNNNAIFDSGIDYYIMAINISNSNDWYATSQNTGFYQLKLDSGVVNTVTCTTPGPYFAITPSSFNITPVNGADQGNNYDFAIYLNPNITDLRVDIAQGPARPGFQQWVSINVNNDGTKYNTLATLKLLKPPTFNYLNATPAISQQSGDTLIWNNIAVNVFDQKSFSVNLGIPANEVIGTNFQMEAWVVPQTSDTTPVNNHVNDDGSIQGSYDPNDKNVSKTQLDPNNITEELKYTIRFQNTGTDTAFNIMVRDELSENLDLSTFQMIGASHPYTFQIRDRGLLEVFFQNILLPDSNINEPLSNGYFQYVVKPKATMNLNKNIVNSAAIYFDFNAPIWTNSVTSSFLPMGVSALTKTEAIVYPNPTTGKIHIIISEPKGVFTLSDINGSIISKTTVSKEADIDLSMLNNGIYIGKVDTEKGIKVMKISKQD